LRICARLEEVGGNCTSSHEWSPIETGNKYNSAGSTAIRNTFFFKDLTSTLVLKRHNYCPPWSGFKFTLDLNTFTPVRPTDGSFEWSLILTNDNNTKCYLTLLITFNREEITEGKRKLHHDSFIIVTSQVRNCVAPYYYGKRQE
jgi:hypothetical protein